MTSEKFLELIDNAGLTARSYSGRGMYGEECVAITTGGDNGSSEHAVVAVLIMEAVSDGCGDEMTKLMKSTRTDSMGRNSVMYWPTMKWPEGRE